MKKNKTFKIITLIIFILIISSKLAFATKIDTIEIKVDGQKRNNKLTIEDFNKEIKFYIDGVDLNSIEYLKIKEKNRNNNYIIKTKKTKNFKKIEVEGENKIEITPTKKIKEDLSLGINYPECSTRRTNAGDYEFLLKYKDGNTVNLKIKAGENEYKYLELRDKPRVISTYPDRRDRYFNPENLYMTFYDEEAEDNRVSGYYVEVEFSNINGELKLVEGATPLGIEVKELEGTENLVDINKKLRLNSRRGILYIPLKTRLKNGSNYKVTIPKDKLVEYSGFKPKEEGVKNRCYSWEFATNDIPRGTKLYEGSVVENYPSSSYPIIIEGVNFNKTTRVYFRSEEGRFYSPEDLRIDGDKLLVYLPIRRRLPTGLYDIILENDIGMESEMVYGVFSVVPSKNTSEKEEIKDYKKLENGIIEIDEKYSGRPLLELDLEKISQGESQIIKYPLESGLGANTLVLKGNFGKVEVKEVNTTDLFKDFLNLRVGKVDPYLKSIIEEGIYFGKLESEIIEVEGLDFTPTNIDLELRYNPNINTKLNLVRYDEFTRNYEKVDNFKYKFEEGRIKAKNLEPGIYFIVGVK